jgi:hypothetical protein
MADKRLRSAWWVLFRIGLCLAALALAPGIHAQSSGGATAQPTDTAVAGDYTVQQKNAEGEKPLAKDEGGASSISAATPGAVLPSICTASPQSAGDNSEAAIKAERKKRFEEAKRRLEQGEAVTPGPAAFAGFPNEDLVVSPFQASDRAGTILCAAVPLAEDNGEGRVAIQ